MRRGGDKRVESNIESMDVLLHILDMLPTSIFVKNDRLQFAFSNAAHCELIGVPAAELLGKSDADFYPSHEARDFLERDRRVLDEGRVIEVEENATNRQGRTSPYLTRKCKIETEDGRTYLIGTNTDLSELKRREASLAAKEARYRALAETAPVGIWHADENGKTIYVNPLLLELFHMTEEEFRAADIPRIIRDCTGIDVARLLAEPQSFETDVMLDSAVSGRVMIVSSGWLEGEDGRPSAMVTFVDVSRVSDLEAINHRITELNRELADNVAKLKDAQDEIVKRGKLAQLGQLTATVAHELRNPLGAIRTSAFLIERKIKGKELGIEPQLQRIANGIERCDAIITQLLDFARSKQLHCEELEFDAWLAKLVEEEAAKLPAEVAVECNLGLGTTRVSFDPARLSRVIINLMSNASEAMVGKGGDASKSATAEPRIVLTTQGTPRGVEVSVKDNGPGIPPDILEKIMEPLFTTKNFGTGLGLSAAEKILEQHGGGLQIASAPGEGACFTLWLPLARPIEEAA